MTDPEPRPTRSWLDLEPLGFRNELPLAALRASLEPNVETAIVALGIALDEAETRDPHALAKRLSEDPARTTFRTVLAQLGRDRLTSVLEWLARPDRPEKRALLEALLRPPDSDSGPSEPVVQAVRLVARHALLARIMARERAAALFASMKEHHLHSTRTS